MRLPGLIACESVIQRAERQPPRDVGEIGTHGRAGLGARDGVAHRAGAAQEQILAVADRRRRHGAGRRGRRALLLQPGLELRRRLRDDDEPHLGVLRAAELRALAAVHAGAIGLDVGGGVVTRDEVALAVQRRHPEAVDHVARHEHQQHGPAGRDVELVGRADQIVRLVSRVLELPPPLAADHVDGQRVVRVAHRVQAMPRADGHHQQGDEHQGGQRPGGRHHPQSRPLVEAPLRLVVVAAAAAQGHDQSGDHRQVDHQAHRDEDPGDVRQPRGLRPRRLERGRGSPGHGARASSRTGGTGFIRLSGFLMLIESLRPGPQARPPARPDIDRT